MAHAEDERKELGDRDHTFRVPAAPGRQRQTHERHDAPNETFVTKAGLDSEGSTPRLASVRAGDGMPRVPL